MKTRALALAALLALAGVGDAHAGLTAVFGGLKSATVASAAAVCPAPTGGAFALADLVAPPAPAGAGR